MGTLGFTGFNALFYAAAHHTTAINIAIIQGTIPVLVLLGSFLFFGSRIARAADRRRACSRWPASRSWHRAGSSRCWRSLAFNIGDVWIVIACLLYAGYALGLRRRPAVPAIVFFAAMAAVACLVSLPLVVAEIAMGQFFMPTAKGSR